MKVEGKVAVVTGAGSGVGRQVVLELLRRGARVAAVDLRQEGLQGTAELADAGERLSLHVADITDLAAVEALPQAVQEAHGAVDLVLNIAGIIQPFELVDELSYEVIRRVIDVNLWGTIHVVKSFLPLLRQRPEAWLTTVSSMGAFLPVPGQTIYGASKAGVKMLTEGLYAELLDTPVGVSVAMLGAVNTNIAANSGVETPEGAGDEHRTGRDPMPADEAARTILDGVEEDKLYILVGRDARMMYLGSRLAPKRAARFVREQMQALLEHDGE